MSPCSAFTCKEPFLPPNDGNPGRVSHRLQFTLLMVGFVLAACSGNGLIMVFRLITGCKLFPQAQEGCLL